VLAAMTYGDAPRSAFDTLGVGPMAGVEEIRAAYKALVKRWHPDAVEDPAMRPLAQEKLIEINKAYEAVMRAAKNPPGGGVLADATRVAKHLMGMGQVQSALRVLNRAKTRDAEWYYTQGLALMALKQPGPAHEAFRAAVRMDGDNVLYRQGALDAAVAARKQALHAGFLGSFGSVAEGFAKRFGALMPRHTKGKP